MASIKPTLPFRWICAFALLILPCGIASGSSPETVGDRYPLLGLDILGPASLAIMDENTLLVGDNFKITSTELAAALGKNDPELRPQLEKNQLFLLDQLTIGKVLLAEAKKDGIPNGGKDDQQVISELFSRKTSKVSVSDKEVQSFYKENRELTGGVPLEQVKENIRGYLLQEKKRKAVAAYISSLKKSVRLQVNESWLDRQAKIAMDNPVDKARTSGKPTLVEFGATGCIPCDRMQPILDSLRKNYPGRLNVVFVHVRKEQILAGRYGIRSIPIQAFYDGKGKEVFRHVGYYPEEEVVKLLSRMGISK